MHPETTLIVVADGEHARFLRAEGHESAHTELSFDSTEAHHRASDIGADAPGASFHTGSTAHHALQPRHDLHIESKRHFARDVAEQVRKHVGAASFDRIVLAAPVYLLGELRDALSPETSARVAAVIPRDLIKTPDHEVWETVRRWMMHG